MTVGEVARAKRRALARFDAWLRVTGCLDGSSYQWELEGLIEDAVECGIQAAVGIYRPLDGEDDTERTTDENCQGECRCPKCGWVAYWSAHWKMHACADPNCRTEFREHNDERERDAEHPRTPVVLAPQLGLTAMTPDGPLVLGTPPKSGLG